MAAQAPQIKPEGAGGPLGATVAQRKFTYFFISALIFLKMVLVAFRAV